MNKKWLRCPNSVKAVLPQVEELAGQGLNKSQICQLLKIGRNTFNKYREAQEAFDEGRALLAKDVAKHFKKALGESYSDRVYLAKSLRIFSSSFEVPEIKTMEQAQEALSSAIKAFSECKLSESELEGFRKALSTFVDSTAATKLEDRLQQLEELINGKNA